MSPGLVPQAANASADAITAPITRLFMLTASFAVGRITAERERSFGPCGEVRFSAAIGAVTDPCTLNLGDPWWREHGGREAYERRCGHR